MILLANRQAPLSIQPYLAGAILSAFAKKVGGIRPMAIDEILRRLVSKTTCIISRVNAKDYFSPEQFGLSITEGTGRVVHRSRTLHTKHKDTDDFVLLKVNLKNAFNNASQAHVIAYLKHTFQLLIRWTL